MHLVLECLDCVVSFPWVGEVMLTRMAHKIMSRHRPFAFVPKACNILRASHICNTMRLRIMLRHGFAAD